MYCLNCATLEGKVLPIKWPILRQSMNQTRTLPCQDIIDQPTTSDIALAALDRRVKANQGDNIAAISMENLFISRIGRCPYIRSIFSARQILDMRNHQGLAVSEVRVLLAATEISHVGRDAAIDDDVLFAGVSVYVEAAEDEEASSCVEVFG